MIKGRCFSNDNDFKDEIWPTKFVAVPRVGECVEAQSGKYMTVAEVTHMEEQKKDIRVKKTSDSYYYYPMIKIELEAAV